jgi:hypothetical protein
MKRNDNQKLLTARKLLFKKRICFAIFLFTLARSDFGSLPSSLPHSLHQQTKNILSSTTKKQPLQQKLIVIG